MPGRPDLLPGSDTGISDEDDVTRDTSPTFRIDAVDPGDTVHLTLVGPAFDSAEGVATGSTVDIEVSDLDDGEWHATAKIALPSGALSAAGEALTFTVDTIAPPPLGEPDLESASDTGQDSTDDITRDTTPCFEVGSPSGSTLTLRAVGDRTVELSAPGTGGLI